MKKIPLFLLFTGLAVSLSACSLFSGPNCASGREQIPDNVITGRQGGVGTEATLCTDKEQYSEGDTVHITLTVKNAYHEPIVLDGGQQPIMDICRWLEEALCLSQTQAADQRLVHLVLEPGRSQTVQWEWRPSETEIAQLKLVSRSNTVRVSATWQGTDGTFRTVDVWFVYGEKPLQVP